MYLIMTISNTGLNRENLVLNLIFKTNLNFKSINKVGEKLNFKSQLPLKVLQIFNCPVIYC
ncbi:hypothetical protein BpHYR1_035804 [Brachionus plicatilis]|uniref:Uncharacterized protein n=1 Tax=Brachionus plicatilis TaxID=10195 RepID=A0A3M7QU18_BRAPC|nr:hypothetical protein BpHYR1_035804 [Brachionus plicatilis]